MSSEYLIMLRKAQHVDEKAVLELVKKVLAGYGLNINPAETDKDLSDLDKYYFSKNGYFAVIEVEGLIVGSYGLCKISASACELRKMYLLPEHQGKGFGKMMMEDALKKAGELGYKEIILETNKKLDKAIHLYYKYGFQEYIPVHLSDRCDFAMKKVLD
jgi:putative acetyltransferase